MLRRLYKINKEMYFIWTEGSKKCSLFGRTQSTPQLHKKYLFIFPPDAILNPWRRKCIKPLTVVTWAALILIWEGSLPDGGWEIDHWWMSVRRVLISTTAFHALRRRIHQAETLVHSIWEYKCLHTHSGAVLDLTVWDNWLGSLEPCRLSWHAEKTQTFSH